MLGNKAHDFDIKCEEKLIPVSSEIQLLGVTLDNKLTFDSHIASICRKVGGQVNALFCLAKPRKHYIVLLFYRILIIVARYGIIVKPGTPRN